MIERLAGIRRKRQEEDTEYEPGASSDPKVYTGLSYGAL